ncbi:MAG: hypothetical protein IH591_19325 [Bacteroidales bacterium]|nr:hypothetical protein [Bacteroidales bacterium]
MRKSSYFIAMPLLPDKWFAGRFSLTAYSKIAKFPGVRGEGQVFRLSQVWGE